MNKMFKRIAVFLCCVLIAPTILSCIPTVHSLTQVEAATKAKAYIVGNKMGIASSGESTTTGQYIYVENKKANAKYTYTSNDKKKVTINKYGKFIGVGIGKTEIVVKETYKGKTKTVGTFKVSVENSKLYETKLDIDRYSSSYIFIKNYNGKAKRSYKSADPTIATVDKAGWVFGIKEGTTTVSVSETYNKVTRSLGNVTVNVKGLTINEESKVLNLNINSSTQAYNVIQIDNAPWDIKYIYETANNTIVDVTSEETEWGDTETFIKGVGLGTTQITVYSEYEGKKEEIGKVNVTVNEIALTEFEFDSEYINDLGFFNEAFYLGEDEYASNLKSYLIVAPYDITVPIIFTSSDETVLKVDNDGNITTIGEGTSTVTATCGTFSDKIQIRVEEY